MLCSAVSVIIATEHAMPITCTLREVLAQENVRRAQQHEPTLTQRQLARDTDISLSVVNNLVLGRTQRIDFRTLDRLCRYFHIQPGDLLRWTDDESDDPT